MRHPSWRCAECGERLYAHVEGDYWCPNCGRRYPDDDGGDGGDDVEGDGERGHGPDLAAAA